MGGIDDERKQQLQRLLKRRRQGASEFGQQADQQLEKLLIRRFDRLLSVKRFVLLWVGLFAVFAASLVFQLRALSPYYQSLQPVAGGIYSEGLVGTFSNADPLYATGTVDSAVSRLIFSGLFKYDTNNQLVGDLATGWSLNPTQTSYTVHLRHNIHWQDGRPFTAADVVFTYQTIQNAGAQSSLYSSWKDINVSSSGPYDVVFDLPNPLSSFPYALTTGIVPHHLLDKIPVEQLRSASFNTMPVGTGPFVWKYVDVTGQSSQDRQQKISLEAFDKYWAGKPKLEGINLDTYADQQQMIKAFEGKQINAMSGLENTPPELSKDQTVQTVATPLTSAVMAFFNNSHPNLGSANIRQALVSGVDRKQVSGLSSFPLKLVDEPLLHGQLGYDPSVAELPFNLAHAAELLDKDGWKKDASGQLVKDGQPLAFSLAAQDTPQYSKVAQFLQSQWAKLGVKITVRYYNSDDLQSQIVSNHDYDILLYGISIGVDPDVFAYWDSSQASLNSQGHLNLSEYKSAVVDKALESARTRADAAVRIPKYKAFLAAWQQDAPALALYQPNFIYISRGPVFNYERKADNSGADRFYNVNNWEIRQKRQTVK